VFTILPSKQVTISLEIKLNTKANLSNGKGDNSITTEKKSGKLCPGCTVNRISQFSFPYGRNQVRT
jgi:hypothetical protein